MMVKTNRSCFKIPRLQKLLIIYLGDWPLLPQLTKRLSVEQTLIIHSTHIQKERECVCMSSHLHLFKAESQCTLSQSPSYLVVCEPQGRAAGGTVVITVSNRHPCQTKFIDCSLTSCRTSKHITDILIDRVRERRRDGKAMYTNASRFYNIWLTAASTVSNDTCASESALVTASLAMSTYEGPSAPRGWN